MEFYQYRPEKCAGSCFRISADERCECGLVNVAGRYGTKVAAFAEHQLWVTPYKPDELYAAGTYVTNSQGKDGLSVWMNQNRSIENTDIVAWYTLGFHHVPRVEDWPVMPVLWHEFMIRPQNFSRRIQR